MSEKIVNFYTRYEQFIKRALIILYDLMVVWVAGVLALLLRFDLSFSKIPVNFIENMQGMLIVNMAVTIAIFTINHLYTSLWAYAGVVEMQRIILATFETTAIEMFISFIKSRDNLGCRYKISLSYSQDADNQSCKSFRHRRLTSNAYWSR